MSKKAFVLLVILAMIIAITAFAGCDKKGDGSSGESALPSGDSVGDVGGGDSQPQDHVHTFATEWS
ncbi:MAG: hypothetical protein K2N32_04285, partial [Clostridia bacterium]|nr:hypothetical protein [Clostridia bacterium]